MIFGDVPTQDAIGAILGHTVRTKKEVYKKGRLLTRADIEELLAHGTKQVLVARLEENDIHEDEAATTLAQSAAGPNVRLSDAFTGRCNLYSECHGLLSVDTEALTEANLIHESLTLATLPQFRAVGPDELIGTAKIIPFSVPKPLLTKVQELQSPDNPVIEIKPFQNLTVGLVLTKLPNTKKSLLDKSVKAIRTRLRRMGRPLSMQIRCNHDKDSVAEAIRGMAENHCDIILVFGPSATVDRRDVVPSGFELAGGRVEVFGIPVDPGNLLALGHIGETTLVGVPGCARSLALNGFDFVLQRLLAGMEISRKDIAQMSLGGLLKETPNRPQPRE